MLTLAKNGVDAETTAPLATAGASSHKVLDLTRKGADVKLAGELVTSDVPLEDIKYYAKNGNDLEGVKWFRSNDYNPDFIRTVYKALNKKKYAIDGGVTASSYYALANNYCNWQSQSNVEDRWKSESVCQTVQVQPLDSNDIKQSNNIGHIQIV